MTVPAYCCSTAAFEGDPWHERVCSWAAALRPQREALPGTIPNDPERVRPVSDVSGQHRTEALKQHCSSVASPLQKPTSGHSEWISWAPNAPVPVRDEKEETP